MKKPWDTRQRSAFEIVADLAEFKPPLLVVAGSRHLDRVAVAEVIVEHFDAACTQLFGKKRPTAILTGCAKGVDRAARKVARQLTRWPPVVFAAQWDAYGKAAGPIRNALLAQTGHALFLIWDGHSPGSRSVRSLFYARSKPVFEIEIE